MIVFFITFVFVFLKAFQQRNVTGGHLKTILPVSILMGLCEYTVIAYVSISAVEHGLIHAMMLGTIAGFGGAFGCYGAIYLHKRMH